MALTHTTSPLRLLVREARATVGERLVGAPAAGAMTHGETMDHLAGGILAAMGLGEVSAELDVRGVALMGTALVAGLERIGHEAPAIGDLGAAFFAFEDLLRRTSPATGVMAR